jgi:kinesin family protein C1
MRPPKTIATEVLATTGIDENSEDLNVNNKRRAAEQLTSTSVPAKRANKSTLTQPPPPKVSSLSNPRINTAGVSAMPKTYSIQPVAPVVRQRMDPSVAQRLEDMEKITRELQDKISESSCSNSTVVSQLQVAEAKCAELEAAKSAVELKLAGHEKLCKDLTEEVEGLQKKLRVHQEEYEHSLSRVKSQMSTDLECVQRERHHLKRELEMVTSNLSTASAELSAIKATLSKQSALIIDLESQIGAYKSKLDMADRGVQEKCLALAQSQTLISQMAAEMATLKNKLHVGETARCKLHNDLQELKGNIRVFCRVRPLLESESGGAVKVPGGHGIGEPEEINIEQQMEGATGSSSVKTFPFHFDKVFAPESSQEQVFEEVAHLVQSALDGFRVCIFAYGQTGSGKTFTMEGRRENPGVIPRAVEQVFEHAAFLRERGWNFSFEVSILEIYNESIRDLLSASEKDNSTSNYDIRHSGNKTIVTDLVVQPVDSSEQVFRLLASAGKSRAVAETLCNDRSSRSHSVFTMRIAGSNAVTNESIEGLLNMIDLAGSERLSSSGSTGDRLKETQAINKSLSALGDVIASIAAKDSHVPFRNSKLTYLLQNSLGGNCKTLMFVNVSPAAPSLGETLCSLRFATKVNSCHIGTARRNAK